MSDVVVRAKYPSALKDSFVVRMPDGMRDMVKGMAAKNRRSMNSELVRLIEIGIERDEKQNAQH